MKNKRESAWEQFHGRRDRILPEDRGDTFPRERGRAARWRGGCGGGDPFPAEEPETGLHGSLEKSLRLPPCRLLLPQENLLVSPTRLSIRWDAPRRTPRPHPRPAPPFPEPLRSHLPRQEQLRGGKAPLAFSPELISLITSFCQWRLGGLKGNKA